MKYLIFYFLIVFMFFSCTEKIELGYFANLRGFVYDLTNKSAVENCEIKIYNNTKEVSKTKTDANGEFLIENNLEPFINYLLVVNKESYRPDSILINLIPGEIKDTIININKLYPKILLENDSIIFDLNSETKKFQIKNSGQAPLRYSIWSDFSWLEFDKMSGTIDINNMEDLTISVDYNSLSIGTHFAIFSILIESISEPKKIYVKVFNASKPKVITFPNPEVFFTSVTFFGFVESDGGLPILKKGFLISESNTNPELNGEEVIEFVVLDNSRYFSYSAINLIPITEYSLTAFVMNQLGTSYGSTIKFNTN